MNTAFAVGALMGDARLLNPPRDGIGHEFFMSLAPCSSMIDLGDRLAGFGVAVRVDPGECANAAGGGPGPGAFAVRHRDALAAFDQREYFAPGNHERIERFHRTVPCL